MAEHQRTLERCAGDLVGVLQNEAELGVTDIHDAEEKAIQNIKGTSEENKAEFKSELKANLIKYHRENNCTLMLGPLFETGDAGLEDFYMSPNIGRVNNLQSIQKDDTRTQHTTEPFTSLEQLFSSKRIVILSADAGVGKTSFCKFLVCCWCAVQEELTDLISKRSCTQTIFSDIEYLKDFTYLFYIHLRHHKCDNLEDIIFSHTKSVNTKLTLDNKGFDDILSNEKGLFILDGLDESDIPSIMSIAANRKYTVLITSRPWKLANMKLPRKCNYTHAQVEVMNQDLVKQLVARANECLNTQFKTSYKADEFLSAVENQHVESHLQNPMFALQLLCVYHDRRNENTLLLKNATVDQPSSCSGIDAKSIADQHDVTYLGKTRSHIYAHMIELMLRGVEKKLVKDPNRTYTGQPLELPACFGERCFTCRKLAKLIYSIGEKAAYSLLVDRKSSIEEHKIENLNEEEKEVLLRSGLLSKRNMNTLSEEINVYTFLHQTYKEMLACVFLSSQSLDSDIWKRFINQFESVMSPDILSFLCVMNYTTGCQCVDMFNKKERLFDRGQTFKTLELMDYQSSILMVYNECCKNGIQKPRIKLKHACFNSDLKLDNALLQDSGLELQTIYIRSYRFTQAINPNLLSSSLTCIWFDETEFRIDNIDFSKCNRLSKISIQDCRLAHVTINLSSIEKFWVAMRPELIKEIPAMKVSFAGGSQFSTSLQELSLVNVTMDTPLDISYCQDLKQLFIDSFTFPTDTHLDLSGLTHLSKITIQDSHLAHVTINPSSIEEFWVYIRDELIQEIPAMKVSFVGGSQFSSSLQKLRLFVTMDSPLDISYCQDLKQLYIDSFTFPADTHLDLSGHTHLSKIIIQNSHLAHVTINPSAIERFWVYMRPELRQVIPAMKVSFAGGSQFSSILQELSLVNVTMDTPLDISYCQDLKQLFIDSFTFPADTHLDLSGLTHLSEITIQNSHLAHVAINPSSIEKFWVYMRPELIQGIPAMKVSFVGGSQFSSSLQELSLVNVTIDSPLDISYCQDLKELFIDSVTFPSDTHLDLSDLTHLSEINIQNSRLAHVTINPSSLEKFWVYMSRELIQVIPAMKVSFAGGSQFSSSLKVLSLEHICPSGKINFSECVHLSKMRFDGPFSSCLKSINSESIKEIYFVRLKQEMICESFDFIKKCTKLSKLSFDQSKKETLPEILNSDQNECLQTLRLKYVDIPANMDLSKFADIPNLELEQVTVEHDNLADIVIVRLHAIQSKELLLTNCTVTSTDVQRMHDTVDHMRKDWDIVKYQAVHVISSKTENKIETDDISIPVDIKILHLRKRKDS